MWLLNAMIIAIAMYSKIPMPRVDWNEKNMRYAMCFFPLVGVIIGVLEIVAGNLITVWKGEETFFYAVVLTLIPVFITGGIHLDGFADTMDAKSSYGDREKKLEILKDPHTGAFAIISLCCYFLLCVGIFSEMRTERLFASALVFVFSRSLSGISVVTFPAAKNSGLLQDISGWRTEEKCKDCIDLLAICNSSRILSDSGIMRSGSSSCRTCCFLLLLSV